MKKQEGFFIATVAALIIGFAAIYRLLVGVPAPQFILPAGFPTINGFLVIWAFLFVIWAIASYFVYGVKIHPRRKRNIFLNCLIQIIFIFIWCYMVFSAGNFPGALAVAIANLILAVVIWFMYLVTHRYGGYLYTSIVVWSAYLIYLSIALVVKN